MMAEEDGDIADEEGSSRRSETDNATTDIAGEGTVPSGDRHGLLAEILLYINDLLRGRRSCLAPASGGRSQDSIA